MKESYFYFLFSDNITFEIHVFRIPLDNLNCNPYNWIFLIFLGIIFYHCNARFIFGLAHYQIYYKNLSMSNQLFESSVITLLYPFDRSRLAFAHTFQCLQSFSSMHFEVFFWDVSVFFHLINKRSFGDLFSFDGSSGLSKEKLWIYFYHELLG